MEATGLSVGKSVVAGALSYAKSAIAEEVALQLGVRRDQAFIADELEMMQAFLMAAHGERDNNKVVKVWVKQVRDVSYHVEDCLLDFAIRLDRQSWWRIFRTLQDRRRVAKEMKELRAKVEDVSQRNMRYRLITGSSSNAAIATEQSSITAAAILDIDEARHAMKDKSKVDLVELINKKDKDLMVIAVSGTSDDLGQTSIIRRAYENPDTESSFSCRAWVRVVHPFNPKDFIQSLVEQFHSGVGVGALMELEKTWKELAKEFNRYVNEKRYLIVLSDLSTIEEWDRIKICLPDTKKGSRIIVSMVQIEVANLCIGQEYIVSELKQSVNHTIYAFYKKGSQDAIDLTKTRSNSDGVTTSTDNNKTVSTSEILEDQSKNDGRKNVVRKSLTHIKTMAAALEESRLVGREKEKSEIITLVLNQDIQQFQVISVWGMGGLGKTTLVEDIYKSQELNGKFDTHVFVTVMRPFILQELLWSLITQLHAKTFDLVDLMRKEKETLRSKTPEELTNELARLLERKRCLIVLDDVSSTIEWDMMTPSFQNMENTSRIIVTTREENIAKHCSKIRANVYTLKVLEHDDGRCLFTKKVFKERVDLDEQYPKLVDHAEMILKKCGGLPLAIVAIGGFLAHQPKTVLEWKKLNDNISAELMMNPELGNIRTILIKSYDGLPYHLKSCFLYLSIFPEDYKISRRRLIRRWIAEGYIEEVYGKSMEEIADSYFIELISRSMILPSQQSIHSRKRFDSCQVHDLIREIAISKSREENLVFRLDEGCSLNSQSITRHLAISSNWKGDQSEFKSAVDMSRVRSITGFGDGKPFFISEKMTSLRVLDLEDTENQWNHHLESIGKLLHLKYLSLRGCIGIAHLPESLGNLRQLETLDVKDTFIVKLPKSIINLRKLNYLRAGMKLVGSCVQSITKELPKIMRHRPCLLTFVPILFCVLQCVDPFLEEGMRHRDVIALCCCSILPSIAMRLDMCGVLVPRGMNKLKALHTLGVVDIAWDKVILKDIKKLTRLRKLGVNGINKRNCQEFCSAIAGLGHLESLFVQSEEELGLSVCLDGMSSLPPENLQSLKLYGNLVKLPVWFQGLQNLMKLKLYRTMILEHDPAMDVLGNLPNLEILRMLKHSFQGGELRFQREAFRSLVVLEVETLGDIKSVIFDEGAMPKLEQLQVDVLSDNEIGFLGLDFLPSIKEVWLKLSFPLDGNKLDSQGSMPKDKQIEELINEKRLKEEKFKENFRTLLAANPKKPILR